jgi:sRNA-binding protein
MSTDIYPIEVQLPLARRQLREAKAALETETAKRQQAERAQHDAEETARIAEERARQSDDDADGWRMFATDLVTNFIIDTRIDDASSRLAESITDSLHAEWSIGRPAIDDLSIDAIVYGAQEELR